MSEQDGTLETTLQRPTNNNRIPWLIFWESQGQPWRKEPEIDEERQRYLVERRSLTPNRKLGIYPFNDIQLNRADVEWLLATHENGRGLIVWSDESQRKHDGLDLRFANLSHEDLSKLPLTKCNFREAQLQGANLYKAQLQGAHLYFAQLQGANLYETQLQGANLREAQLQGANLREAQLQGAKLSEVTLADKDHIGSQLADVQWGDTNLAIVDWTQITILGEEYLAHQQKKEARADINYQKATRAYRQLSVVLRNQGLNEDAARFTYRAQLMQRKVFSYQGKRGQYLFSLFLDILSGYGYKPGRCFIAYLLVIVAFATAYFIIGCTVGQVLSPLGSVVFSVTSFHGRGFFPGGIGLDDPLTVLAAIEAFVGLLIEVTFIATLTQRLFGK